MKRITTDSEKAPDILGAGPLVPGRDPSVPRIRGAIYQVAKRLKEVLNPLHSMAPGTGFLDEKTLFKAFLSS
jgi:hypothetical protein